MKRPPRPEFRRIVSHLLPGWPRFLLLLMCVLTATLCSLIPPLLIRRIIDHALPEKSARQLYVSVALVILAGLVAGLAGVWKSYIATRLGQDIIFDLRCRLHERLLKQSLRFFTQTRAGEILSRIQNDVGGIQGVVSGALAVALANLVMILGALAIIFYMDWRLALAASTVIPLFIVPTLRAARARSRITANSQQALADMSSAVQESLSVSGFLLVRLFGAQSYEGARFATKSGTVRDLKIREGVAGQWFLMWIFLFAAIGPAFIYLVGGREVIEGRLTVGTVVAFASYLALLYTPTSTLVSTHLDIMSAVALFRRIFDYLDMPCDIQEPDQPVHLDRPAGHLRFEAVSMRYEAGSAALTDISFVAEPGKMVALVGHSGAGKTTVTYLASRLYDPTSGRVLLDGVDIRNLPLCDLSRWIGTVTQETTLFNASVAENLRYARPDASSEEMEHACRLAQIHDVIAALPLGYSTLLGERGYTLSGGERQRIAIARVLLRDPRLLILDEATSSLDSRSEAMVRVALDSVLRGRTSLVVAHRLSTILQADLILVLDKGSIAERGTHEELLARRGLYANLYETQFATTTAA